MNKIIFNISIFFIGSLTLYAQELKEVLKTDTIYVNINKGFSVNEVKSEKSFHLPCYNYYFDSKVSDVLLFNTCRWLDEARPYQKIENLRFLNDKTVIDLDFIKKVDFLIVGRKFIGKKFYVIKDFTSDKIEITEAQFSGIEGSVNDHATNLLIKK